jgi:2-polyprenyl-6-methoxyphenol hydroxylase-like FAD-dependent oxidoreductase
MRTQTEILIIGAGPTGMALSIALHQAGVDHLLHDRLSGGQKHLACRRHSCADA